MSVGETEDAIVALFCAAYESSGRRRRTLVILDDVEHILAPDQQQVLPHRASSAGGGQSSVFSHLMKRSRSTFLTMVDAGREKGMRNPVLVLCTSKQEVGSLACRTDRIYYIHLPRTAEIRDMIIGTFDLDPAQVDEKRLLADERQCRNATLLDSVVESCVGKSYAEVAQYCREAVQAAAVNQSLEEGGSDEALLKCLKSRLLSITPASLRDSILDEYVDLRVMNAIDLGVKVDAGGDIASYEMPLRGSSAARAWGSLVSSIVIPLCRSRELEDLLYSGSTGGVKRIVTGGALICGPPGSGKSAIALHCARYAATLLPSVKVLDVSCTSLIHKEVGGSERAVHHLFDAVKRAAPCIVMMDGIENVAAVRGNDATSEGTMDRVLSTLLVEMDGVDTHRSTKNNANDHEGGIAVIGITQDASWVDPALQRPGRLDKVIELDCIYYRLAVVL